MCEKRTLGARFGNGTAKRKSLAVLPMLILTGGLCGAAVVIDRIAVVVERHPIKLSDIERDVRLTDFLNKAPLRIDTAAEKAAEERLIDQQVIRQEIASGGYTRATDADAENLLGQIRRDRFGGSEARLRAGLIPYGLTEDQLRAQLLWQLTVLRFINERFRNGATEGDQVTQEFESWLTAERKRIAIDYKTGAIQ